MWQHIVVIAHLFIVFIVQVQFLVISFIIVVHLFYDKMTALIIAISRHIGLFTVEARFQHQAT